MNKSKISSRHGGMEISFVNSAFITVQSSSSLHIHFENKEKYRLLCSSISSAGSCCTQLVATSVEQIAARRYTQCVFTVYIRMVYMELNDEGDDERIKCLFYVF